MKCYKCQRESEDIGSFESVFTSDVDVCIDEAACQAYLISTARETARDVAYDRARRGVSAIVEDPNVFSHLLMAELDVMRKAVVNICFHRREELYWQVVARELGRTDRE